MKSEANTANEMQKGQVEMQIRELISSARSRYQDKAVQADDELFQALIESAHEDVLNAYDETCAKYIDEKVDKKRFKKLYFDEIRQLVTDEANKQLYI
ncbi:hypothetical protein [Terrisporobacter vanillatitrophus]|uniref:hypothetical protein n=1 Tax=Terrisporobacter vanillatitrophus TaxID=3058402 RepID=UPI003368F929